MSWEHTGDVVAAYDWDTYERVIVLSPHLDDAILSCGGLLWHLRRHMPHVPCLVVSICTADSPLTTHARHPWRDAIAAPSVRRQEDRSAMSTLDCPYIHLGFLDAIDRMDRQGKPMYRQVFHVDSHPDDADHERELALTLRRICAGPGPTLLVSPIGIGGHIDHVQCSRSATALGDHDGVSLLYYEDVPYRLPGHGPHRHSADDPAAPAVTILSQDGSTPDARLALTFDTDTKVMLVAHYQSQVPMLFGDREQMRHAFGADSAAGGPEPIEVYWTIAS